MLASRHAVVSEEAYLGKVCRHNSAVGELPAGECLESLGGRLWGLKLHIDLPNTSRLSTSTDRPGDLDGDDLSVLFALLPDVIADF